MSSNLEQRGHVRGSRRARAPLCLDRRVGRRRGPVVVRAQLTDRAVDVADRLGAEASPSRRFRQSGATPIASASSTRSRAWSRIQSMPRERAKTSSGSRGVTKASRTAFSSSRLAASPRCSASRRAGGRAHRRRPRPRRRPGPRCVTAICATKEPETSGRLRQEPAPSSRAHVSHRQTPSVAAARAAVAGRVISQARPIWRTIAQWTWRRRRRPPPMPTTEDATTWRGRVGAAEERGAEDDARRRGLACESLERLDPVDASAHGRE